MATIPATSQEAQAVAWDDLKRRLGMFRISRVLLETSRRDLLLGLFGKVIVVRCELRYDWDAFEYLAISPEFDEVPLGQTAPEYRVEATYANGSVVSVTWKRLG